MKEKKYLSARTGSLEQIAYAERSVMSEGKANGTKIISINNGGGLSCILSESRCLDILRLEYKGTNLGFLAKPGIIAPQYCCAVSSEFMHYFHGGMLYTCGLDNVGPSCEDSPLHGRISITPAEKVFAEVNWDTGEIEVRGIIKQAEMFGRNLVMERNIHIPLFGQELFLQDRIENRGFQNEDIMLLYHFNFGWPLLSEDSVIKITNNGNIRSRDEYSEKGTSKWDKFEPPADNCPEQVFYHSPVRSQDGDSHAVIWNEKIKLGADISFDPSKLPYLIEWKSLSAGDYALGLEPATCLVEGRETEMKSGRLVAIKPGTCMDIKIKIKIIMKK